jgi:hypothetical protein
VDPCGRCLQRGHWRRLFVILCACLSAAQIDSWRAQHEKSDRYEGTGLRYEIANPKLELLSFMAAPGPATLTDTTLQLSFFTPQQAPVRVWAQERDRKHGYWMEPKPPAGGWKANQWNSRCGWKSTDLDQIRLAPGDLGVVIRLDNQHPASGRVAPAIVTSAGQTLPARGTEYEASLRLGMPLAQISYAVTAGCKSFKRLGGDVVGVKHGGEIFSIRFNVPREWTGETALGGTATPETGEPDERQFCFMPSAEVPSTLCQR